MKPIMMDLREMSLSKEAYSTHPHIVFAVFIYGLLAMIIIALIWSYFGQIDMVVKANGMIRPNAKTATVTNAVTGEVKEVYFVDGQFVEQGEVLYIIDFMQHESDKAAVEEKMTTLKHELYSLNLFRESVEAGENRFLYSANDYSANLFDDTYLESWNSDMFLIYSNRYNKYTVDMESIRVKSDSTTKEIVNDMDKTREELDGCLMLKNSIVSGSSLFSPGSYSIYHSRYLDYLLQVEQLNNMYLYEADVYEKKQVLGELGGISIVELNESKNAYDTAKYKLDDYMSKYLYEIDTEVRKARISFENLNNSFSHTLAEKNNTIEQLYLETLVSTDNQIKTVEQEILQYESELLKLDSQIEASTVRAQIDGNIYAQTQIIQGSYLMGGINVMTIIPVRESVFIANIYVSNDDILGLEVGMPVRYDIFAMPRREYGEISGVITRISEDINSEQNDLFGYYLVEADVEDKLYYDTQGNAAELRVGMNIDARIITGQQSVLFFLLEKLDMLIR